MSESGGVVVGDARETVRLELKIENVHYSLSSVSEGSAAVAKNETEEFYERNMVISDSEKRQADSKGFSQGLPNILPPKPEQPDPA